MNKSNRFKILIALLVILLLMSIRAMENQWFPESLIGFFGSEQYLTEPLPPLGFTDYFNMLLRYLSNSVLSVILIFILFEDKEITKFVIKLYMGAGIFLFLLFLLTLHFYQPGNYRILFYIRRLLIHPVILFILLPVIYFVRSRASKKL